MIRTAHTRERAYAKMARIFYSCVIFGVIMLGSTLISALCMRSHKAHHLRHVAVSVICVCLCGSVCVVHYCCGDVCAILTALLDFSGCAKTNDSRPIFIRSFALLVFPFRPLSFSIILELVLHCCSARLYLYHVCHAAFDFVRLRRWSRILIAGTSGRAVDRRSCINEYDASAVICSHCLGNECTVHTREYPTI